MIQHVVVWKFKEGTEDLQNQFVEGLKGLVGQIDGIRSLHVGRNENPNETYDVSLVMEFDNMEDLSNYANDPRHLAVAKIAKENAEVRACVDFTI